VSNIDDEFYKRADAHIHLANSQISEEITRGRVSASMMYATARFNAWVSACGWQNSQEMTEAKDDVVEYFISEYRKMLEENFEDYIENYERYMKPKN